MNIPHTQYSKNQIPIKTYLQLIQLSMNIKTCYVSTNLDSDLCHLFVLSTVVDVEIFTAYIYVKQQV